MGPDADARLGARGNEFDGITEEVGEDLSKGRLIALDDQVRHLHFNFSTRRLEVGIGLDHVAEQRADINWPNRIVLAKDSAVIQRVGY